MSFHLPQPVPVAVFLGLGSNLGDRDAHLRAALRALGEHIQITDVSSVYDSAPMLVEDQPRFHNAVCAGTTLSSPEDTLAFIKSVEVALGRVRGPRYGPRVIDIDLLLYDELVLETSSLAIPHPRLRERAFVLVPLAEIAPDLRIPPGEETVAHLAESLPPTDIRRIGPLLSPHG